ncbi:MAG: hypothetical protein FWF82_07565 [Oscillospiraceae bacterium]|nr:hypothetical protein [Oscillospiraceae bacterium]
MLIKSLFLFKKERLFVKPTAVEQSPPHLGSCFTYVKRTARQQNCRHLRSCLALRLKGLEPSPD